MKPRVIAFEGVDGAGKSTVLGLVAKALRERDIEVFRPRIGKEHLSRPTREIRRLTRDRRNLELRGRAELLLYAAREAQVLDQHVRPALAAGKTVLLDRSMLTPVILGAYGRGLELEACERITAAASEGLDPELTLIFDVDPRTSRVRKRLDKVRAGRTRDPGRKGLSGSSFKQRLREGYQTIAAREGFPVIHAERADPETVAARVLRLLDGGALEQGPEDARPWWQVDAALRYAEALDTLPPLLRLYFSRRVASSRALRAELFASEPALAIWAADLDDPLLERAAAEQPARVLARLAKGPRARSALAQQLRARLVDEDPEEVARSLTQIDDEAADELRRALSERAPGAVVESLAGRSDDFAEELRARLWKQADSFERALSLQGCDHAEAWRRRERLLEKDPPIAIQAMVGLDPARVDPILERYADRAPKSVLRALRGRGDAAAHGLRRELLETGREVVDTIIGLDDPPAWALREQCAERWPSTVLRSLEGLELDDPRAKKLLARCREAGAEDLFVKRRLARLDRERP